MWILLCHFWMDMHMLGWWLGLGGSLLMCLNCWSKGCSSIQGALPLLCKWILIQFIVLMWKGNQLWLSWHSQVQCSCGLPCTWRWSGLVDFNAAAVRATSDCCVIFGVLHSSMHVWESGSGMQGHYLNVWRSLFVKLLLVGLGLKCAAWAWHHSHPLYTPIGRHGITAQAWVCCCQVTLQTCS